MGKKYIVEIGRLERLYKAHNNGNGMPNITWLSPEVDLTPYTEPDLEQVRNEAYQRGLNDAWEVSRKIIKMNDKEASAIFGTWLFQKIFEGNSASEAIEKLQEHEQDLIKMGDEVLYEDSKGVVIAPEENGHWAAVFTAGGERICVPDYKLRKTGKHYPEIANIVRELRKK